MEVFIRLILYAYTLAQLGVVMSEKSKDESKTNAKVRNGSLIDLLLEKIYKESIAPLEVCWVALQNLNDVVVGNYFSLILFGLSTAFLGAWLTCPDRTQKSLLGLFGLILFVISVVLHVVFVFMKIRKWKKGAIKRSDFK